jgi:hypothetical protein
MDEKAALDPKMKHRFDEFAARVYPTLLPMHAGWGRDLLAAGPGARVRLAANVLKAAQRQPDENWDGGALNSGREIPPAVWDLVDEIGSSFEDPDSGGQPFKERLAAFTAHSSAFAAQHPHYLEIAIEQFVRTPDWFARTAASALLSLLERDLVDYAVDVFDRYATETVQKPALAP